MKPSGCSLDDDELATPNLQPPTPKECGRESSPWKLGVGNWELTRFRHIVPRPIRLAASAFLARRRSAQLQDELAAMVARSAPIVAGPWLGEVGFELLY